MALENRSICLDTETTGLSPEAGHRIIEIGAVELINGIRSGKTFQIYLDPERDIDARATEIHGYTREMLAGKSRFCEVVDNFLSFIGSDTLIIHNAPFDLGFINSELKRTDRGPLTNKIVDTLITAKKTFPGAQASLDALCRRFKISLESRSLHGALLDADLLAQVYLRLMGGPQTNMGFGAAKGFVAAIGARRAREARPAQMISPDELARHNEFVQNSGLKGWITEAEIAPEAPQFK